MSTATHDSRFFYSVAEAGQTVGLCRSELYKAMAAGELGSVRYGRRRLIPAEALRDFASGPRFIRPEEVRASA